ncbi:MAG TPA: zf-HC2 domain-containing protein [Terriglobales bacterium]|nr:zf-HC2 domain-containing protein [Terriglobales bacterium]
MIDHEAVAREKITEKYLLDELDPLARDEFEAHYFNCPECALDVRVGSALVEELKRELTQTRETEKVVELIHPNTWLESLRPSFTISAFALLLVAIAIQTWRISHVEGRPQVLPWAAVTVGTWGSDGPLITTTGRQGFLLFVRIPPGGNYSQYAAALHGPDGKVEWSLIMPVAAGQDQWSIQVPPANRESGDYTLDVNGISATGETKEVGHTQFQLKIDN